MQHSYHEILSCSWEWSSSEYTNGNAIWYILSKFKNIIACVIQQNDKWREKYLQGYTGVWKRTTF